MEMGYIKNNDKLSIIKNMTEQINKSIYDKNPNNKIYTDVYYNMYHGTGVNFIKNHVMIQRSWFMISNDKISNDNPISIKSIVVFDIFEKIEDINCNNFNTPNYNINISHFEKKNSILDKNLGRRADNLDLAYIALIELNEITPNCRYQNSN
jgi:hypothetical protein